jgi:hypothetical protein
MNYAWFELGQFSKAQKQKDAYDPNGQLQRLSLKPTLNPIRGTCFSLERGWREKETMVVLHDKIPGMDSRRVVS